MSYLHLENEITSCVKMGSLWEDRCSLTKGVHSNTIIPLIKTITKFFNVIGYQQPDLSINWTVYAHHACNWTVRERKREPVEAAGYRAVRSLMAMQKKSQIFQLDFRVIRFCQ